MRAYGALCVLVRPTKLLLRGCVQGGMAPRVAISLHGVPARLTRPGVLASLRALAAEAHTSAAASPSESPRRGGFVPIDWRTVDPGMEAMELSRSELHINSALWVEPKPELTGEGFELGADRRVVSSSVLGGLGGLLVGGTRVSAPLLEILVGQTACVWVKAGMSVKTETIFAASLGAQSCDSPSQSRRRCATSCPRAPSARSPFSPR